MSPAPVFHQCHACLSAMHSSLRLCPGTAWRTRLESSKYPREFSTPFGSQMCVTAEGEDLLPICISDLGRSEQQKGICSVRNDLGKKCQLNSIWKTAKYINNLTIQVSVSSK